MAKSIARKREWEFWKQGEGGYQKGRQEQYRKFRDDSNAVPGIGSFV